MSLGKGGVLRAGPTYNMVTHRPALSLLLGGRRANL